MAPVLYILTDHRYINTLNPWQDQKLTVRTLKSKLLNNYCKQMRNCQKHNQITTMGFCCMGIYIFYNILNLVIVTRQKTKNKLIPYAEHI